MRFTILTNPLHVSTLGKQPLGWTKTQRRTFKALENSQVFALVLSLPDITKPFHLFLDEARSFALGSL